MRCMRRRAPVVALALAAPLILSSSSVGSDPAPASSSEAAVCQAGPAAPQRSVEEEVARLAASVGLPADQDVVMLNGRGYNYGPPQDQRLDRIGLEALKAEALLRKSRAR